MWLTIRPIDEPPSSFLYWCFLSSLYHPSPSSSSYPSRFPCGLFLNGQKKVDCFLFSFSKNSICYILTRLSTFSNPWLRRNTPLGSKTWRIRQRFLCSTCLSWPWSVFWASFPPPGCVTWLVFAGLWGRAAEVITCGRGKWGRSGGEWLAKRRKGVGISTWEWGTSPRPSPALLEGQRGYFVPSHADGLFPGLSWGLMEAESLRVLCLMAPSCHGTCLLRVANSGSRLKSTTER